MKRLAIIVSLLISLSAAAAQAQSQPVDLVVLVDTSASMLPYWKDTTDYLIKNILTDVLEKGDTFHLISFASHPEVELSRKIEGEQDIKAVLARFLLLQPLGRYTDLVAAVRYLYEYASQLPTSSKKDIIILTDGIDDPPPGSKYPIAAGANGNQSDRNRQIVVETAQAMRRRGWEVHIIQYPRTGSPSAPVGAQPGVQLLNTTATGSAGTSVGAQPQTQGPTGAPSTTQGGAAPGQAASTGRSGTSGQPGGIAQSGAAAPAGAPGQASGGGQSGTAAQAGTTARGGTAGQAGGTGQSGSAVAPPRPSASSSTPTGSGQSTALGSGGAATTGGGAPSGPAAKSGGKSGLLNDLSHTLGVPIQPFNSVRKQDLANVATGAPSIRFPRNLGSVGRSVTAPFVVHNFEGRTIRVRLTGVISSGRNLLRRPVTLDVGPRRDATLRAPLQLPASLSPGPQTLRITLQFADSLRASPSSGELAFTVRQPPAPFRGLGRYVLPALIGIVLLAIIVLLVIFFRRLARRMGTAPARAVVPRVRLDSSSGDIEMVELRVVGQNPNIGGRNIHPLAPGTHRSVGGGASSFLIYLYPCPGHIAELVHSGQGYDLVLTQPEYFPGLSGEVRNCLGREITVQPDPRHLITIVFRSYVSPLDQVNRIMHLVDRPGTPNGKKTT